VNTNAPVVTAKRVGFLELFFDLVFVFAVTQLVGLLHGDHTAAGWGRAALMMWLIWWAWSQYTWAGNAIDLDRRTTRIWITLDAPTLRVTCSHSATFPSLPEPSCSPPPSKKHSYTPPSR
jgi:low temperature requirement protein LtrA